eukprot:TRINITY_DN15280_c0_g1_i1.p1 TRINITY_DN15280_c0_g1~~TRINITY_DN15280_c0_g1_i1.p1  ORF type:complete len:303 (+),score=100.32 TRINITY_DN15280_c0_g1_i1:81-911(+)
MPVRERATQGSPGREGSASEGEAGSDAQFDAAVLADRRERLLERLRAFEDLLSAEHAATEESVMRLRDAAADQDAAEAMANALRGECFRMRAARATEQKMAASACPACQRVEPAQDGRQIVLVGKANELRVDGRLIDTLYYHDNVGLVIDAEPAVLPDPASWECNGPAIRRMAVSCRVVHNFSAVRDSRCGGCSYWLAVGHTCVASLQELAADEHESRLAQRQADRDTAWVQELAERRNCVQAVCHGFGKDLQQLTAYLVGADGADDAPDGGGPEA